MKYARYRADERDPRSSPEFFNEIGPLLSVNFRYGARFDDVKVYWQPDRPLLPLDVRSMEFRGFDRNREVRVYASNAIDLVVTGFNS